MALFTLDDIIESPAKKQQRVDPLLPPQVTPGRDVEPQQGPTPSRITAATLFSFPSSTCPLAGLCPDSQSR